MTEKIDITGLRQLAELARNMHYGHLEVGQHTLLALIDAVEAAHAVDMVVDPEHPSGWRPLANLASALTRFDFTT